MRARPPIEQGMTTIAPKPAEPLANGALKSRASHFLNGRSAVGVPISSAHTWCAAFENTRCVSTTSAGCVEST